MKRILILICTLLLLADLADDGCLGKVKSLAPRCPGTISVTSSLGSSDNIESQVWILLVELVSILQRWQNQLVIIEVHDALSITNPYFFSSSGGLPL